MYTEISHFLLLHAIFLACLLFFCFLCLSLTFQATSWLEKWMLEKRPTSCHFVAEQFNEVYARSESGSRAFASPLTLNKLIEMCSILPILLSAFFFLLSICFFGTIGNSICSDFSIYNTTTNSSAPFGPMFYKISATWSNHEGSLLLWCWLLSLKAFLFSISLAARLRGCNDFKPLKWSKAEAKARLPLSLRAFSTHEVGAAAQRVKLIAQARNAFHKKFKPEFYKSLARSDRFAPFRSWITKFFSTSFASRLSRKELRYPEGTVRTEGQRGLISAIVIFFTTFCVMTSNPFLRTSLRASINSLAELNPVLQDPILAIHPPCIYAGYVASAVAFSLTFGPKDRSKQAPLRGVGAKRKRKPSHCVPPLRGRTLEKARTKSLLHRWREAKAASAFAT